MAKRIILNKKAMVCACAILFIVAFGTVSVLATSLDVSYSDPKNDLRCFTKTQLENFAGDYQNPPEDPDEYMDALRDFWSQGTLSPDPNCIDMELIRLKQIGAIVKLTITVEGNITDCEMVDVLIWGNCTDGSGIAGNAFVQATSGGPYQSYYAFVDAEGNPLSNGTADIDGGNIEMSFPASAWGNESCSLYIMMVTVSGTGENQIMCADIFPNSVVGEPTGNELGANVLSEFWAALYYWFVANWWWLLIVACAIVVAVVMYHYWKKGKELAVSKRVIKSVPSKKAVK